MAARRRGRRPVASDVTNHRKSPDALKPTSRRPLSQRSRAGRDSCCRTAPDTRNSSPAGAMSRLRDFSASARSHVEEICKHLGRHRPRYPRKAGGRRRSAEPPRAYESWSLDESHAQRGGRSGGLLLPSAGTRLGPSVGLATRPAGCSDVAHGSVRQLNTGMRARIEHGYENPGTFVWTKSADEMLDAIARHCRRIVESRH